jgi:pantoate--beta-alanine ligase
MQLARTIAECRHHRAALGTVAFVPTMGALHAGHTSLMELAKRHAPRTAVSIFVNPTQFGPKEDFNRYPRPLEADLAKCEAAGVDLVFAPSPDEIYPPHQPEATLDVPALTASLEGKHRPGHFKGVCQVVVKLFNIVQPQTALFGQKDFQQLRVIQAMTRALDLPIDVVGCPTLRDPDGLAMSSRNAYLSPEDRARALSISRALRAAADEAAAGIRQTNRLMTTVQKILLEQHLSIDYVAAVDAETLKPVDTLAPETALLVAARVGPTRLIDNMIVKPPAS